MIAERMTLPLKLDLDVDAGREVELHQRVHGLRCRVDDVEEPLVRPDLELLTALLVDVRRTVHRVALDARRQRHRTTDLRARAPCRLHDLPRRGVEHPVVERLQAYANILAHDALGFAPPQRQRSPARSSNGWITDRPLFNSSRLTHPSGAARNL